MDASNLQSRLASLLTEARAVELDRFDEEPGSAVLHRVVPEFSKLLALGRNLLGEIEEACSSTGASGTSWALPDRVEELETLCFFVDGEWKRALDGLERLTETTSGWSCLVQVECARDRLIRGIIAVEKEYAAVVGSSSVTGNVDLLGDALAVRRSLTLFRREINSAPRSGPPSDGFDRQLRHADGALARLIDREEFALLRAADRHLARELHRRVERWLRGGSESQELGGGEGLWQDVVNFAELLWDVNRRDELVGEDLAVIEEARSVLEGSASRKLLPPTVADRLRILFGRDDELDDLLEATAESERVLERLQAVRDSLRREDRPQLV